MKVTIPDSRLDYFISEDVPYIDLTSEVLRITDKYGRMQYFTREDCILCGTEEVARIAESVGLVVTSIKPSGTPISAGESFLEVEGEAGDMHRLWKVGLNLLDHLSAVSTNTKKIVDAAYSTCPECEILTTRKSMPGVKDLLTKAVTVGGAYPHRLGISETVLIFDHHIKFLGGFDAFIQQLPSIMRRCVEKKVFVEAGAEHSLKLAAAGVDGIQFDKIPADELDDLVEQIRAINPNITLIAAGGINAKNAADYAKTGVDGLATTAPFSAKPLDMSVKMEVI